MQGSPAAQPRTKLLRWLDGAVIVAALFTIPLTVVELNGQSGPTFEVADWVVWGVFLLDYSTGLALTPSRSAYLKKSLLRLAIVVVSFPLLPTFLGLSRLARLARLFRLARLLAFASRALPAIEATLGRRGVLYLAGVLFLLISVSGALMSVVEPGTVKGDIWAGMWWAVVTATTVGYGDISPVTPLGRLIAVVLMFIGIGLTATLAASIAARFVSDDKSDDEIRARLARIELMLTQATLASTSTADRDE